MKLYLSVLMLLAVAAVVSAQAGSFYDLKTKTLLGKNGDLAQYRGKVSLVVNVASKCGFTPQYTGLEVLHRKLAPRGFAVLGFPCDQFGHQEPGDEAEIKDFCRLKYDVSFPMFAKIEVNGEGAHPLYKHLKTEAKGILGSESVKWNFTKFLIDKEGRVVRRYAPNDKPESIEADILALL